MHIRNITALGDDTTTTAVPVIPGALAVIPPSAVVVGTPSAAITAKGNCVVSGGSWSDADQKCTMPQPAGEPSWWTKQPDSTKVLIIGGAAVGTLALIAVALGAFRGKYKSNPPRGKRTGRGRWRYDIIWNRRTGKWRLVAGTTAQRRSWKQLGLLAKPGKAYNAAMKQLGHGAERRRNYDD